MDERIVTLWRWIRDAKHAVFFGGAGMSTESGLADFRSAKRGLYNDSALPYPPEEILSHEFFYSHPDIFFDFYRTKLLKLEAKPNTAHYVLAELERRGLLTAIVTQNADNLHQRAGSKRVLDLHGNVYLNTCTGCGKRRDVTEVAYCSGVPRCECGGMIKPGITLFGEPPDAKTVFECLRELRACDLIIIGGTSLRVSSAGRLLDGFKGKMVIINDEDTAMDERAALIIRERAGKAFSALGELMETEIE